MISPYLLSNQYHPPGGLSMSFIFEKLDVYQQSVDIAVEISKFTESFPKGTYYLTDQLNRAALSVVANIAEGNGRWHANDRKSFFWIARGSAQECVAILEVCRRREFITIEVHERFKNELEKIGKMICGLIRGIDKKEE
jgi:four helix bundle protein